MIRRRLLGAAALGLLMATPAAANEISPFTTALDTDWAIAGFGGMRGQGNGQIRLGGVNGPVHAAYLYWHGPARSASPGVNASVQFNGQSITGQNIGLSDDNLWPPFDVSHAYRADVTALVPGSGTYRLDGFRNGQADVNGVALIVFFDDGDDTNNRDVVLFDGNDSNIENRYDPEGWDVRLTGIDYPGGPAGMTMVVSDGQDFGSDDDGRLRVNGNQIARGGIFQGNSTPNGSGGARNGSLWDIRDFDIAGAMSPGPTSLNITMGHENDALSVVAIAIDLPAGSAPEVGDAPPITRPEPEPEPEPAPPEPAPDPVTPDPLPPESDPEPVRVEPPPPAEPRYLVPFGDTPPT